MKYLAIIQARCGSARLPEKVLKDIHGKPAIERMLSRVSGSKLVDEIMVATTIEKTDIPIVKLVSSLGYRVFAGSGDDVLDRYYQAAKLLRPEYVIRLTADCPLLDWRVIDAAIEAMKPESDDLYMLSETFPDGEDVEITKFSVLEEAWRNAKLASEREHVTLYIKNHPEKYNLQDFVCPLGNLKEERWTMDEVKDLELIRKVYEHFLPDDDFTMKDIYDYLRSDRAVWALNREYVRNEGLLKSLREDYIVERR